jgi:phage I-like protein
MRNRIAFCAALAALTSNATEIQLLPAGEFRAIDGRPAKGVWKINAQIAERLKSQLAARENPLVIDYEHQTLRSIDNGQAAPAAGWLKSLEWREGEGLFAKVEWTERAKGFIAAGEYRYISPVIKFNEKTGEVEALGPPALVNYPAIDGMQAVKLAALAERYAGTETTQETHMNALLAAVLAALGIKEDTKPEDATTAIATLKTKAGEADSLRAKVAELEPRAAKATELETQVASLSAAGAKPDPSKFVPIESFTELQSKVAALTAGTIDREVNEIVTAALTAGKLLPASEQWARDLGKKDIAALRAFVATAPAIAALAGTQTQGKQPGAAGSGLTASQESLCAQLGVSHDDYKKQLAAAAA